MKSITIPSLFAMILMLFDEERTSSLDSANPLLLAQEFLSSKNNHHLYIIKLVTNY